MFEDHYIEWRSKRIDAILAFYGDAFFENKSILEIGCGFGDIGASFHPLKAQVTCSDARLEYLETVKSKYEFINTIQVDLDKDWPFQYYDLIIHMGVLYHLANCEYNLRRACKSCRYMVLESEVCDCDDPYFIIHVREDGYDQSYSGIGCRPSPAYIERILMQNDMKFIRVNDARCNSGSHLYDWVIGNTKFHRHGMRRFWFCERVS